jgi:hypothetical protein
VSLRDLRRWVATADHGAARSARRMARAILRARARRRSGSVTAEMDRIGADARSATTGSALSPELLGRRRTRGHRRRAPLAPETGR